MREIKFRAKSGTQWRYGDLYHNKRGELVIYEPKTSGRTLDGGAVDGWRIVVDPETVGQYIGLKDLNGHEIYEGDIVRCKRDDWADDDAEVYAVEYFADLGYPAFELDGWTDGESNGLSYFSVESTLEVIGNIHDNPDLLEKQP